MDKGKGVAASEQGEIKSAESDDERAAATGRQPHPVVGHGASSSTAGGGGASSSSTSGAPSATQAAMIAPFEDGQFVRLRNRGRGGYLFANENGRGVCVDGRRGMVNTAWFVQIVRPTDDAAHVLLHSAYGLYLTSTFSSAGLRLVGRYTVQHFIEDQSHPQIAWKTTMGKRGSVVLLQGTNDGMGVGALRANGRYQRWNTEVTFGPVNLNQISSMMEWEVQVIPQTLERPPYYPRPSTRLPKGTEEVLDIAYARAWFGDNGTIQHEMWIGMRFRGRRLTRLRNEIANLMRVQPEMITLFTQAGFFGRSIPLLTDLQVPGDEHMILALMIDSPGYNALRFPDLAAE